jgi:predicted dehydrogenase
MAKSKVRVALIGAGMMASRVHYPSLASFDDVEIAGVGELLPDRLKSVGDEFGISEDRRYELRFPTDYRGMIEKVAPDGVYVIGQPHLMYDIWIWCLEQGLNLYIEKPMGITLHQAQMLAHVAEEKGVITQVSHQRRSCPLLVKMKDECLKKGPITHAICQFYKCDITPFIGARDRMLDDGTHAIDTVRWMCGGEVVDIDAECKRVQTPDVNWIGVTLQFDNGSTGYAILSWSSGRRVFRVEMHSPGIYTDAEVENKAYLYADGDYKGVEYDTKEVAGSAEIYVYGGFRAKNREFIDSIKSGIEKTSSPFRDCIKTMEVVHQVLALSALKGD